MPRLRRGTFAYRTAVHLPGGPCFDVAKEGYVNLLCTSKSADKMGDSKESACARHAFLERGYYGCLKEALTPLLHGNVLDICCGEGYYDSVPADGALYGFDLSKTMVRLAAKRKNGGQYFVANLARMPVAESCIDTALHLFAALSRSLRLLGCWRPAGGCTA